MGTKQLRQSAPQKLSLKITHRLIVGVTAHALSGDAEPCFKSDMDEYMTKPISVERLKQTIQKHCQS